MSSPTLRKASTDDSEFAYGVKRAAFKQYVEKVSGWDEDEALAFYDGWDSCAPVKLILTI